MSVEEIEQRPSWRGWFHAVAFAVAIPAGVLLIVASESAAARTAASIYAASLVIMFGMSAAYHRLAKSPLARRRMQRLDHAGIFLLIAGTYVPMTIVAMPRSWGLPLMAIVGSAAVVGVVLKVAAFDRVPRLSSALYPLMGWAVVIAIPVLYDNLSTTELAFVVAGGVIYTLGIPVLFLKRPDPWPKTFGYHEIWHTFVVVAAGMHFVAVAGILA